MSIVYGLLSAVKHGTELSTPLANQGILTVLEVCAAAPCGLLLNRWSKRASGEGAALFLQPGGGIIASSNAMYRDSIISRASDWLLGCSGLGVRWMALHYTIGGLLLLMPGSACGSTLWNDSGATLIFDSGSGRDILEGALKRDDASNDTLYFKFHIDPLSDSATEEYFASFSLFEGDRERVGVGNAPVAWAYTAFFHVDDLEGSSAGTEYVDLHSSNLAVSDSGTIPGYELPRRGVERTLVFKVQYVAGGEDLLTVWLNPDLSAGATEILQPETLTTRFTANASFDEIHLRHGGGGEGWVFSDLSVATSFMDFVDPSSAMPRGSESSSLFDTRRFRAQTWHRESGMPRAAIQALAQTADGYLWLAGEHQVARFDGARFVALDLPVGMDTARVRTLVGDSQGTLWIGTAESGLARYAQGGFDHLTTDNGLPTNEITAVAEGNDNRIWIGTSSGLRVWCDGRIQSVTGAEEFEGYAINALFHDGVGSIWIGAQGRGVFRLQDGKLMSLTDPQIDDLLREPQCLLLDPAGRLWVGAGVDQILCHDGGQWHRFRIPEQSKTPHVKVLLAETDGTVWAGSTAEGLFLFQKGKLTALNSSAGLHDNQISALLLDREGNIWAGGGSGLHLLRREHSFFLGQREGLGHGVVASVTEVAPGVIWVIQPGRGLHRWEGRSFRRFTASGLDPDDPTLGAMLVTGDGACWIACTNGLRLYRDPQAVADESLLFALPNEHITTLAEDPDGSIWAGTENGHLWRLERGIWSKRLELDSRGAITALASEPDGLLWVATDGDGLYLIDEQIHARFDTSDGLPDDTIHALHRDAQGRLWMGTGSGELGCVSKEVFSGHTIGTGALDCNIQGILEDSSGQLWLSDQSGLICIRKPERSDRAAEVLAVYPMEGAGSPDIVVDEDGRRTFPQGCLSSIGRLWFGAMDGVVVAEPPDCPANSKSPLLILEEILVDGFPAKDFQPIPTTAQVSRGDFSGSAALRVAPGKHQLELFFTSPDFRSPGELQFRYRMEGLDQDWVDAGTRRSAFYSYVPPGDYVFSVAVHGPNGTGRQVGIGLSVSPHFWQRWWVIATAAIGLLATIGGGARFVEKRRVNHRMIRLEQEHALERERARIAQDLHDEMGAKLCRISFLSEHAGRLKSDSDEIKEQISSIADDSRELLHALDEIVWVVNPRNDTLEHVVSYLAQCAQNYFHGTGVECEMDISSQLPDLPVSSQVRHHLFLAVNEALTNVLKHAHAKLIKVGISWQDSLLTIRVEDNGCGFVVPDSHSDAPKWEKAGNGLPNMHQRMAGIGGQCRLESRPGCGTVIHFLLEVRPPKEERNSYDRDIHC